MPHSFPMTKDRAKDNLVVNLNNFSQEQMQEEQISLNLTQDTMRMQQLLLLLHLLAK